MIVFDKFGAKRAETVSAAITERRKHTDVEIQVLMRQPATTTEALIGLSPWLGYISSAAFYGILVLCTVADFAGDTRYYANDIIRFSEASWHGYPNPLWDFGHLYWRPLGWILFKWFTRFTAYSASGEEAFAATALLVAASIVSGLICTLLFYSLASRLLQTRWKALLIVAGMLSFSPFLDYVHAGTSYITCLIGLLAALCVILRAVDSGKPTWHSGFWAGACFAVSVLFWFPCIVMLPGVLATALLWRSEAGFSLVSFQSRLRLASSALVFGVSLIGIGYLIAIFQLRIHSLGELRAWFSDASHGWSQTKQLVRLPAGLARSFLYLGDDGLILKRWVLKDPYAPIGVADLIRHFWKLAVFYALASGVAWSLWRSAKGRRIAWICVAGMLPLLAFAVVLFETGSPERFLPFYPFACVALAYALSDSPTTAPGPTITFAFLAFTMTMNVQAFWKPNLEARIAPGAARVTSLQGKVSGRGMVAILTMADSAYQLTTQYPLHPVNRTQTVPIYLPIEIANVRVATWKPDFAKRALDTLERHEGVWISKRFLAERPDPAWGWTEGDDRRISWKDLPTFFCQFSYGESVGGADGFLKLEPSEENLQRLTGVAAGVS